jgi:hypothetical protein
MFFYSCHRAPRHGQAPPLPPPPQKIKILWTPLPPPPLLPDRAAAPQGPIGHIKLIMSEPIIDEPLGFSPRLEPWIL